MFFTEGKRQVSLLPVPRLLRDSQGRKRIKINFAMPMSPENLKGAPIEVEAAFDSVAAASKGITKAVIDSEFEHVAIEFYPLADKPMAMKIQDATVQTLWVNRKTPKEGAPTDVFTHMSTTVAYTKKLWNYIGDNAGFDLWVSFVQAQGVFQEADAVEQGRLEGGIDKVAPKKKKKAKGKTAAANDEA